MWVEKGRTTVHGSSFWGALGRTTPRYLTDCRGLQSYSLDLCTSSNWNHAPPNESWEHHETSLITHVIPVPPCWNYTFGYALSKYSRMKIYISMPSSHFIAVRVQLIPFRFSFIVQSVNRISNSVAICFLLSSISLGSWICWSKIYYNLTSLALARPREIRHYHHCRE